MKKSVLFFVVTILLAISLFGCDTKSESDTEDNASLNSGLSENNSYDGFSKKDIVKMSNYMNEGTTAEYGSWIYGTSFDSKGNGTLTKIKTDGTEQKRMSSKYASYINISDVWLYYIGYDNKTETDNICRIRLSGSGEKVLSKCEDKKSSFSFLFIYNDKLYYSELTENGADLAKGKFYSMDLDGKNKAVILNKAVYYPYIINNKLYYQDDNDYCHIHVCDLDGQNDKVFINEWVYQYIYDGKKFYYITYQNKELTREQILNDSKGKQKRIIKCCNNDGTSQQVILNHTCTGRFSSNGEMIYFTDWNDVQRLYSYNTKNSEFNLLSNDDYVDSVSLLENGICYFDHDKDYYIENIYYCNFDGTYKRKIFKDSN